MIEITDVVVVAVIIGLGEMVKKMGWLSAKYLPLFSLISGVTAGVIYFDGELKNKIMFGIILGLTAAGLFDQSKIITKKDDE